MEMPKIIRRMKDTDIASRNNNCSVVSVPVFPTDGGSEQKLEKIGIAEYLKGLGE